MALSLSLPLSGIEREYFYGLGVQFLYDQGLQSINGIGPYSPSVESESSSGFSSLPSVESGENVTSEEATPPSSRPQSPIISNDELRLTKSRLEMHEQSFRPLNIMYNNRDILNLAANIRDPVWMLMKGPIKNNQSKKKINEGLPNICNDCEFCESIYTPWF